MKTKIPIKRYVDDPKLSWEERYRRLEAHHEEETKFLIKTIEDLERQRDHYYELVEEYGNNPIFED